MPHNNLLEIYDGRSAFWQWDTGQKLKVLDKTIDQVHFSNKNLTYAIIKEVYIENDVRVCDVPDVLLKLPQPLIAYTYVMDVDTNKTTRAVKFSVNSRPIPEDYTYEEDNRFKDLVDKIESVEDILDRGTSVKRFNSISEAEDWAKESHEAGALIAVLANAQWIAYIVNHDLSISRISGDNSDLITSIKELRALVGDSSVFEQIHAEISKLKYDEKGSAAAVQDKLYEEISRAQNEESAITRALLNVQNIAIAASNEAVSTKRNVDILNDGANVIGSVDYKIAQAIALIMDNPDDVINSISELIDFVTNNNIPEGSAGADGFSPIANVVQTDTGATITVTDKNGTTTATVVNGKDGVDGQPGKDGYTPVKGVDYFDGKDGIQGEKGDPGEDYVLTESDKSEIAEMAAELVEVPEFGGSVDLTGYATEQFVRDGFQPKGNYLAESALPTAINTALAQAKASGEFDGAKGDPGKDGEDYVLTYADKQEIAEQAAGMVEIPSGYATEEFVKNKIAEAALEGNDIDLSGYAQKSEIPTKVSQLQNDEGYLTEHQDLSDYAKNEDIPTKPEDIGAQPAGDYALKSEIPNVPVQSVNGKTGAVVLDASSVGARPATWTPTYTDVGADKSGTASSVVSTHNTNTDAHNDIRLELKSISDRLNAFFDSDDKTLDELSEIVAYITSNKTLINNITTSKVNVADIINDLVTSVANKPLSAEQGVALKSMIDAVGANLSNYALKSAIPTKVSQLTNDNGYITGYTETDPTVPAWAKAENKPSYTKSEIGLENVDNVRQYSVNNPPPYPVTSVNGKTGDVMVTVPTVPTKVSAFTNDAGYLTQHQDISGKLDASALPTAINSALAQAKASGEFDGKSGNGIKSVRIVEVK